MEKRCARAHVQMHLTFALCKIEVPKLENFGTRHRPRTRLSNFGPGWTRQGRRHRGGRGQGGRLPPTAEQGSNTMFCPSWFPGGPLADAGGLRQDGLPIQVPNQMIQSYVRHMSSSGRHRAFFGNIGDILTNTESPLVGTGHLTWPTLRLSGRQIRRPSGHQRRPSRRHRRPSGR